jgi:hypothetical protein
MPYDRNDAPDDMQATVFARDAQPETDELANSLAALFAMFGGQVLDQPRPE